MLARDNKIKVVWSKLAALTILLLVLSVFLASCGGSAPQDIAIVRSRPTNPSPIPTIAITAVDYGYEMTDSIKVRAGLVDIAFTNNGTEAHQAQIARLNNGISTGEVLDQLVTKKKQAAAFWQLTFVGGADTIAPGYGQEVILNLAAGRYTLLCFVVSPDGISHVSKGMIHFFTVLPAQEQLRPPQVNDEISMQDSGYKLPPILKQARALTLQVINQGAIQHEMNIVRLAPGKTAQDIATFFQAPSGPPPFEELGGLATIKPGSSAWIKIDLDAGNYAVFSFIPDPRTGKSQLSQGMLTAFTVQ